MTVAERYIDKLVFALTPNEKKQFKDGMGYILACPFCRDAQKRESKSREKCASIYPVEGTYKYFFSCNRGLNGGVQGVHSCDYTMRFSTFLKKWNPSQYTKYVREKELAKQNYKSKYPD